MAGIRLMEWDGRFVSDPERAFVAVSVNQNCDYMDRKYREAGVLVPAICQKMGNIILEITCLSLQERWVAQVRVQGYLESAGFQS
jgi:hypothetical protein